MGQGAISVGGHERRGLTRREFGQIMLAAAPMLMRSGAASGRPPNILLLVADDLGTQLGCFGDPQARTPHLDRLAAEGVRFSRAYVTQSSCSPSRSSMLTGLYPHQNGQIGLSHLGYSMRPALPNLPGLLQEAGYRTGIIGKLHVAPREDLPFDYDLQDDAAGTRRVRGTADRAAAFFDEAGDQPFFLMVNLFDPHRHYDDADQVCGVPAQPLRAEEVRPFGFLGVDSPAVRRDVATFYNCVSRVDTGVGMILDELDRAGHATDTVVVFLGDNGPPFTRAKTTCYEAGLQTPLVVRWPGSAIPGRTVRELASTVDLMPTLLEIAGVSSPCRLPGRSLVPLLRGAAVDWRRTVFAEYTSHAPGCYFPRRALRGERFKLIHNLLPGRQNPLGGIDGCAAWAESRQALYEGSWVRAAYDRYRYPPEFELYNLAEDPNEFHDRSDDPALAEVRRRFEDALRAWRVLTHDPLLDPVALANLTRRHEGLCAPDARWTEG